MFLLHGATFLFARELISFPAGNGGWQLGTIAVGNVDQDPDLEIIVPCRDTTGPQTVWSLDAYKANGQRLKGFPFAGGQQPINVSPTLFDLDGDGRAEILFTCGNRVIALRGDGTQLWSTSITARNYLPNAGYQAVTNGFYWSASGAWRDRLPDTADFFSEVSSPIVADVDATGSRKIVTAWKILPDSTSFDQDYNPFIKPLYGFGEWGTVGDVWSGGVIFLDATTGKQDFTYHIHQLIESGVGIGRPRPGQAPLVYVLNDSDSVVAFDKTQPYGLWGHGMLYRKFGKNQRLQSGSYLKGVDIYPADIDGDGEDELLVPTTQLDPLWQPSETILDDDGAVLWRRWKEPAQVSVANGWLNNACMIPVNPDHDNRIDVLSFTHGYEIAFRSWNGIELVDRPGWPKNFYPYLPTPPLVGDVDGDGAEEIIIGTYDPASVPSNGKIFVFALDGREQWSADVPGGLKHIPTLADVDHDGSIDLIYRSLAGRVSIHNFGAPASARVSWATHHGNVARDGNRNVSLFPPGTPLIIAKESGHRRISFRWRIPPGRVADSYEVFRAEDANGVFRKIAALSPSATSFTDFGLSDGWQYFYELRARYGSETVASAPFAVLSLLDNNLIANAGFEENDNSHWDKWFTGEIPWQNMTGSGEHPYQGERCMEVRLANHGNNSSIKQANQYGIPEPAIRTSPGKLYSFGGWFRSQGISQPSEHWLEWNTSRTGENTNDIPAAPWPYYFTPPWKIGTGPTAWTYANRVFVMPDGFPNVELRHRYTIDQPGTGSIYLDNLFFRELPLLSDPRWRELIPFGATWRYSIDIPVARWQSPGFDASSWPEAPAKFGGGTGTTGIATPLPLMKPAYYFRREFTSPADGFDELLLAANATDDFNGRTYPLRLFLNGTEIMTTGIDTVTGDGNTTKYFDLTPFADLIHPGLNAIAVVLQNAWAVDWDNVAFDLSLRAVTSTAPAPRAQFTSIATDPDGGVTLHVAGPVGSRWRIECASSADARGPWQSVQTVTIESSDGATVSDEGDKSRLVPWAAGTRFYRLSPE
ncbi:MAG: VCBS repeat-containing protein [Verrucomicrobiota bacterium]